MTFKYRKAEKPKILSYFPSKAYGQDGDTVVVKMSGKGVFFCVKAGGLWYAQTTMQPLSKINTAYIKNLQSDKLTLKRLENAGVDTDKFIVLKDNSVKYRTGDDLLNDIDVFASKKVNYKTAYCSLQQYSDKETCEANGGTWYYSENDSHDNVSSTAENQLLTVSQSIGNVDAEPTLLYDGSTLNIKYNSDYDDNWQTSAQTNLLKLSYDSTDSLQIGVAENGASTISTVDADGSAADLTLAADGATKIHIFDGSEADSFHININGATNQMASFYGAADDQSIFRMYEMGGASTADYLEINVAEHGATTIHTVDGAATAADLILDIDGDIELNADGGDINFKDASTTMASLSTAAFSSQVPIYIKERADAALDVVSMGQLWVHDTAPNELCFTDDLGTDIIGVGKYHYETKFIGYVATATGIYLPMTGYVFEQTSTTGKNEFISFIAPYNGTIQKVGVRTEIAQSGDADLRVLESTDGTEIPGSTIFRNATAISIADDTYFELDMTDPVTGSSYSPLTKGRIYNIYLGTPAATYDTNVTIVFKWDITS